MKWMNAILAFVPDVNARSGSNSDRNRMPMMNGFEKQTSRIHDTKKMKNDSGSLSQNSKSTVNMNDARMNESRQSVGMYVCISSLT
jgi:hypothetical protein